MRAFSAALAARRALVRIAQADNAAISVVTSDDILRHHEILRSKIDATKFNYEQANLRKAISLPIVPLEISARLNQGNPTFADAIVVVGLHDSWGSERGRVIGALEKFNEKLESELESTLAIERVEREFQNLTHMNFSISANSFATFRSRVRRAVRVVDIHARRPLKSFRLSGEWQTLVAAIGNESGGEKA